MTLDPSILLAGMVIELALIVVQLGLIVIVLKRRQK